MKIKNKKALKIFLSASGIILIVTAIYVIRVLSLTTSTNGHPIRKYSDPKSALLVIGITSLEQFDK